MNAFFSIITLTLLTSSLLLAQTSEHNKRDWDKLSEADRAKVREALKEVWSDSKVLSARANVKRSVEEYQNAVREAIATQDPDTAKLMAKIDHVGLLGTASGHKRGMMKKRPFEQIGQFPQIVEKLDPDEASEFKSAAQKASEHPDVVASWEKLKQLREANDRINRDQHEAINNLRLVYLKKIVEYAPKLSAHIDPIEAAAPKKGKGGHRSMKGKGHRSSNGQK